MRTVAVDATASPTFPPISMKLQENRPGHCMCHLWELYGTSPTTSPFRYLSQQTNVHVVPTFDMLDANVVQPNYSTHALAASLITEAQ